MVAQTGESTHLVLLIFGGQHQKIAQLALKGIFQQNFQEYSDFVRNSYGESWDSSCEKSWVLISWEPMSLSSKNKES